MFNLGAVSLFLWNFVDDVLYALHSQSQALIKGKRFVRPQQST